MQEEVENRTVNLMISTTKLTWRALVSGYRKFQQYRSKVKAGKEVPHGKQTVKKLIGQNQGVSSIDIANTGIRDFDRVAKKYGVDYAIKKDRSVSPPKYLVFFKAIVSALLSRGLWTPGSPPFFPPGATGDSGGMCQNEE